MSAPGAAAEAPPAADVAAGSRRRSGPVLLALAVLGFASIGLPDGLLGVALPSIRASFALAPDDIGALLVVFVAGYLSSSFASGWILARMNVGTLLAASGAVTALGLGGYAAAPTWVFMVACALFAGLGAGAIDAGINTWAAVHQSPRVVSWLHASYGMGTAAGPALMTAILMRGIGWRSGYALVAAAQVLLAAVFLATRRLWPDGDLSTSSNATAASGPAAPDAGANTGTAPPGVLRLPAAWLGVAIFVLYTGLELATGVWTFSVLAEGRGVAPGRAGPWVSAYWTAFSVGRIAAGLLVTRTGTTGLLRASLAGAFAGALLLAHGGGLAALAGVALVGFGYAPVFPVLISTTPLRVPGALVGHVVGFQIAAAALGQAALPWIFGGLVTSLGYEAIPVAIAAGTLGVAILHEALLASSRREART